MTDISGFSFKNYTDRADFVNKYPKRVLKNPKKYRKYVKKQIKKQLMQQNKYGALQIYTNEVKVFGAYNGLYDMAGNVEEWTMDTPDYSDLHRLIKPYCFGDSSEFLSKKIDNFKNALNILKMDLSSEQLYTKILKSIDENDFELFSKIITALVLQEKIDKYNFPSRMTDVNEQELVKQEATEKAKAETNKFIYRWWKEAQIVRLGNRKIAKGGSWASGISHLLIASARAYNPDRGYSFIGFRLAFSIDKEAK
jgi:hypothetical protein